MARMLVCGWNDEDAPLLEVLRDGAGLRPAAVGDASAVRLVRARGATRLPCYQHPRQMARLTSYDAALLSDPTLVASLAPVIAARHAALLLVGDRMDGAALTAAGTAALRYGVPLAVLRPALRAAGSDALRTLIARGAAWRPIVLAIELRGQRPTPAMLRDATALALELTGATPNEVVASRAGRDVHDPLAMTAQVRFADGSLATATARAANVEQARISLHATAGVAELECEGDRSTLAVAPAGADPERSLLGGGDGLVSEAARAAAICGGATPDIAIAQRTGAVLSALERSLEAGRVQVVDEAGMRAKLRLLPGRAHTSTTPSGRLQVVPSEATAEGA